VQQQRQKVVYPKDRSFEIPSKMKIVSSFLLLGALALSAPVIAQSIHDEAMSIPDSERQSTGSCGGLRAQRKEISDLSNTEWNNYVRALNGLRRNGVYAKYVRSHSDNADLSHNGCYFLPWHREYLYSFERELNKIVPGVSLPYWDWTRVVSGQRINRAFANDPVWKSRMGGANGNGPIPNAPFKGWSAGGQTCRRGFTTGRGNIGGDGQRNNFISSEDVGVVVRGQDSFANFTVFLELAHNAPHIAIGQTMGAVPTSPLDPMFWSHHAQIDRIYRSWQLAGSGNSFGGTWNGGSCTTSRSMTPFRKTVSAILSNTSPCTRYVPSSSAGPTSRPTTAGGRSAVQTSSNAMTFSSSAEKNTYLATVAQKKRSQPSAYKAEVLAGLDKIESMQRASRAFKMPEDQIKQGLQFYRTLLLKRGVDVVGDASIGSMNVQAIAAQGKVQAGNALSVGSPSSQRILA
jgi:tyrosinase